MVEYYQLIYQDDKGRWDFVYNGLYGAPKGAKQGVTALWRRQDGVGWTSLAVKCRIWHVRFDPDTGKTESSIFAEYGRPSNG